ncbi:MAG: adenylate/guanylate cyclase domain-containing protein, partial [Candidatus Norongarragalinales archaeon]
VVRTGLLYRKSRDIRYAAALSLFLIFSTEMWFRSYGVRVQNFFEAFRSVVAFLPLAAFLAYDYLEKQKLKEKEAKEKMKSFFERYVSPHVIKQVMSEKKVKLGGERQEVTVLFTDIRGFTSLSERLEPEQVVAFLNEYFETGTRAILKHDGTVDKFIGDAIMAVFNAPVKQEDHAIKAVQAAIEMQEEFAALSKKFEKQGIQLGVGIGINTGDAVVGNIGSRKVMEYTAIGDTVNTASRLQGIARAGEIIVSENTFKALKGQFKAKRVQEVQLKGKAKPLKVFVLRTV